MDSAFEAIIIGEKLTTSTGNSMEMINLLDPISDGAIYRNNSESDRPPSAKETQGNQIGVNQLN